MNNNKFLMAVALCAASSLAAADYSIDTLYHTGTAQLSSTGGCKMKRTQFPNAQYGVVIDNTTSERFEGVLSSDNQLLAKFSAQRFTLTDLASSTARAESLRQIYSYSMQPESLNYLITANNCSFMQDDNNQAIVQTIPAQNTVKTVTALKRAKTNDWLIKQQVNMVIIFHGTTLITKSTNPSQLYNRSGAVSNITFSFKHTSSAASPAPYFPL